MSLKMKDVLFLLISILLFVLLIKSSVPNDRFGYDESDYMYAVSKGFLANYTDQNAIPFFTFLNMGRESGLDSTKKAQLSEFIRSTDDITLYRHYHSPLVYYFLSLYTPIVGPSEYATRWGTVLFHVLCFVVIYAGCTYLLGESGRIAAVMASLFYLSSVTNIEAAFKVSPHSLYTMIAVITLFLMTRLMQTKLLKYWYASLISLSFAIAAIEYSSLLVLTLLISLFTIRKEFFGGWKKKDILFFFLKSIAFFLIVFAIIWPGGVFKLTAVKNFIFLAYFAIVRSDVVGTQSAASVWWNRVLASPVEYIILAASVVIFVYDFLRRKNFRCLLPFAIYIFFMLLTTIGNRSPHSTYISSLLAPFFVLSGIMLSNKLRVKNKTLQYGLVGIILAALLANNTFHFIHRTTDRVEREQTNAIISFFSTHRIDGEKILIPHEYTPNIHYYFRDVKFGSFRITEKCGELVKRVEEDRAYAGVLYYGAEPVLLERELKQHYPVRTHVLYDNTEPTRRIYYYRLKD